MKYYSKVTLAVYVLIATCLHMYTIYYVDERFGSAWSLVVFFLPGLSQVVLCFVSVYMTNSFFNTYTNIAYSSIIVFSIIRFVAEDMYATLLDRAAYSAAPQAEDPRVNQAMDAADQGDYKQACRIFLKIYREDSLHATACFGIGACLLKMGKKVIGLGYIEKAAFLGNVEARIYLRDVAKQTRRGLLPAF